MISSAPARQDTKLAIMDDVHATPACSSSTARREAGWVTHAAPARAVHQARLGRPRVRRLGARSGCSTRRQRGAGRRGRRALLLQRPTPSTATGSCPRRRAEAFRGDYCTVGDMARRDEDGYIHLVDRKSNMIISGGENVYPSEVESVLGAHPTVKDVAVIGAARREMGRARARGHRAARRRAPTRAELLDWCKDRIAGYKRPRVGLVHCARTRCRARRRARSCIASCRTQLARPDREG